MGNVDHYEKMEPSRPNMNKYFVNARIEQYWEFNEKNGKVVGVWYKGVVVVVLKNNHVHIDWKEISTTGRKGSIKGEAASIVLQ